VITQVAQTVHTAGVNWDSVAAIVGIISGVIATFAIIAGWVSKSFAKYITNQITSSINQFRIEVVATLENRLTRVEDMAENLTNTVGRNKETDREIGGKQ
jgi:ABC-type lipoprotein release transport system permease subunit